MQPKMEVEGLNCLEGTWLSVFETPRWVSSSCPVEALRCFSLERQQDTPRAARYTMGQMFRGWGAPADPLNLDIDPLHLHGSRQLGSPELSGAGCGLQQRQRLLGLGEAHLSACGSSSALMHIKRNKPNFPREYLLAKVESSSSGQCAGPRLSCMAAHCANNSSTPVPPWGGPKGGGHPWAARHYHGPSYMSAEISPPFLPSCPALVGKGEARCRGLAWLPCSFFGCWSPAPPVMQENFIPNWARQTSPIRDLQWCFTTFLGLQSPHILHIFLFKLTGFPQIPFAALLRRHLGGLCTCSSQAGNGCPQHMSQLTDSLLGVAPLPAGVDFNGWAQDKWCHWRRLWSRGTNFNEFTKKLSVLNLSMTEEPETFPRAWSHDFRFSFLLHRSQAVIFFFSPLTLCFFIASNRNPDPAISLN